MHGEKIAGKKEFKKSITVCAFEPPSPFPHTHKQRLQD